MNSRAEYCAMMQALELGIPSQQSELDLRRADDIKINELGPVMRAAGNPSLGTFSIGNAA
jgi:hypothetical protein